MNRRRLLDTLAKAGAATALSPVLAQASAGTSAITSTSGAAGVIPVLKQELPPVNLADWMMSAVEVTYAPGEVDTPHRHPSFVFGYVLEGALRFQVDGQPETTYHTGQMFYEAPGSVHRVSANASATQPVRFLAMVFAHKGTPLTDPA